MMNRAERRRLARNEGKRGSKAKRRKGALTPNPEPTWMTPDGKLITQSELEQTIETAKRMRERGFDIVPSLLWTPGEA